MATSFFSEISYHFKRILSKIKFTWLGSRKSWFFFLLLFKMVILYFWQFLAFCFQVGWHHYFIHLLPPQKLCRRICQRSYHYFAFHQNGDLAQPKPLDKISQDYKQWFFLAFSPLQNIVIILLRPVLSKNKKTKKKLIIIIKVVKKS